MAVSGPAPQGPSQPAPAPPRQVPPRQARRGPGCLAWAGAIVVATVLLCCAGAAAGAGAGWFVSRPDDAAIPPASPEFPAAASLPLVDADQVVARLDDQGYDCRASNHYEYTRECSGPDLADVRNSRVLIDDDDAGTRSVTVECVSRGEAAAVCQPLFTQAAGDVLAGHPVEVRQEAQDWVGGHIEATATTTVGEVELTIRQLGYSVELRIWPA